MCWGLRIQRCLYISFSSCRQSQKLWDKSSDNIVGVERRGICVRLGSVVSEQKPRWGRWLVSQTFKGSLRLSYQLISSLSLRGFVLWRPWLSSGNEQPRQERNLVNWVSLRLCDTLAQAHIPTLAPSQTSSPRLPIWGSILLTPLTFPPHSSSGGKAGSRFP